MKAQQAVTVVKEVTASASNVLKALGCGTFFGLVVPAFESTTLDAFVNAAVRFSAVIRQQLVMVQNHPAPAEFAEKTVAYAKAKTAYFTALREEMPELINSATRRKLRPLQLDNFIATFAVAGEKQEEAADEKTLTLLERFSANPDVEKARTKFELAQKIEEAFHKDFDGIDLTSRSIGRLARIKFTNLCIGCDINKDAFESAFLLRIPILQDGRLLKLAEAKRGIPPF